MSSLGFLILVVAFVFLWFVLVRPQRRRQSAQQRMLEGLRVGDQVLTAGGIYGEITGIREDEVTVELAPQLEVRVARRAIAAVIRDENEPVTADEPREAPAGEDGG